MSETCFKLAPEGFQDAIRRLYTGKGKKTDRRSLLYLWSLNPFDWQKKILAWLKVRFQAAAADAHLLLEDDWFLIGAMYIRGFIASVTTERDDAFDM